MFYELINNKRNEWLQSANCTVRPMLQYIEQRGMMRDAQIEAIKTYLFLKIACKGKPSTNCSQKDISMKQRLQQRNLQ